MENNIETLKTELLSDESQNFFDKMLTEHYGDCNLSEYEITRLRELLNMANAVYNYSGEQTGLSDENYDILYEKLEMAQNYEAGITVPIIGDKSKVGFHKYKSLRGTLDKIYYLSEEDKNDVANKSRKGLPEWVESSQRKINSVTGKNVNLWNEEVYVFPKWDGVSCIFEFTKDGKLERALTRGFTETNEAQIVTHIFEDFVVGPWNNKEHAYGHKTEIMMSEDDLKTYNEIYNTNYKNSRSIVSSIMNSDEKDDRVKYLQIMSLRTSEIIDDEETLQELAPGAFERPFLRCRLCDTEVIKKFAFDHKYVNGLRCDGAVIYLINRDYQKILGRENNKQKFEVAFKFTEETGYSKVKGIKFTIGLFGRINPVLEIKPIKLKGNTITNISLGSYARFKELNLAEGDKVKILYDIIPYCIMDTEDPECKRSGNEPISEPEVCPECGEELTVKEEGSILYCANPDCPCRKKGKILNFLNKMNIDNISYATVDVLYDEGYLKKLPDIYKLKDHRKALEKIPGFGKQSVDLILSSIESKREVSDANFLGSLGIESIGRKMFDKVLSEIPYETLLDGCLNGTFTEIHQMLCLINGISDKTASKIIFGLRDMENTILKLEEELTIISVPKKKASFSVCFTKIRSEDLEKWIIAHGGEIADSLTKKTNILVVPTIGMESSKTTKAKKYGIKVIPIDDVESYITETYLN